MLEEATEMKVGGYKNSYGESYSLGGDSLPAPTLGCCDIYICVQTISHVQ